MNTGLDAICEVFNILTPDGTLSVSRYLMQFDNNEIKEIHVSIFKFYLYNKMTVIQISNATGMRRTLIEYSINKISNLLKEDLKIKQLYNHYLQTTL
jgi:hypothetical protein